jgi:hypothetical protein
MGYKEEGERWKIRALDLARDQFGVDGGIEDLEDCWTNLRTEAGEIDFPLSQLGESMEDGQPDDRAWAYYVRSSRRCQMERNITELQRQVRNLERTVERLKWESISRFDPYFGSIEVDVDDDDDTLSPFPPTQIAHHYVRRANELECTRFVNQLFPALATSFTKEDVDVDIDDGTPPTPISLFCDIFSDLDPVTSLGCKPASAVPTVSRGTSDTLLVGTPVSADNADTGLPAPRFPTVDEGIRKIQPTPHQLEGLGDWARNVLVVLEADGDGEEMGHLEWTWELIKQFQSCLDSQKSVD